MYKESVAAPVPYVSSIAPKARVCKGGVICSDILLPHP